MIIEQISPTCRIVIKGIFSKKMCLQRKVYNKGCWLIGFSKWVTSAEIYTGMDKWDSVKNCLFTEEERIFGNFFKNI